MYQETKGKLKMDKEKPKFVIQKDVKQGDPLTSKFTKFT